jgi:hypothetical protein
MLTRRRSVLVAAALTAIFAGACAPAATAEPETEPAIVDAIDGSSLKRVTLTDEATQRLGIETATVKAGVSGRLLVPTSTVVYDATGQAWVYTNPQGHVFERAQVTIAGSSGAETTLSAGPPVDTMVVTVGVAELYGAELGVGDPE